MKRFCRAFPTFYLSCYRSIRLLLSSFLFKKCARMFLACSFFEVACRCDHSANFLSANSPFEDWLETKRFKYLLTICRF